MTKLFARSVVLIWGLVLVPVALVAFAGAAFAQAGSGAPAAEPAAPPAAAPPAAAPPAASPPLDAAAAHKACVEALNADPKFEAEIVQIADKKAQKQRDDDTIQAHQDALHHIQKNEKHVIYAYAGMWIVAAAFVIFLWRRQQALKLEIIQLRRELEAGAADGKPGGSA